jgi:hypothetical protein
VKSGSSKKVGAGILIKEIDRIDRDVLSQNKSSTDNVINLKIDPL